MEAPTQQQPMLSQEALHALYRDLGESRHAIYERNVKIVALQEQVAVLEQRVKELEPETPQQEPSPLAKVVKGGTAGLLDAAKNGAGG